MSFNLHKYLLQMWNFTQLNKNKSILLCVERMVSQFFEKLNENKSNKFNNKLTKMK